MFWVVFNFVILALVNPVSALGIECANDDFSSESAFTTNWECVGDRCLDTWSVFEDKLVSRGFEKTLSTLKYRKLSKMTDFNLSLDIQGVEGVDQQIIFRASDDLKTYYMVGFRYHEEKLATDPGNNIVLYKFVNGNYWLLKRVDPSAYANLYKVEHNVQTKVRVIVSGNNIKIYYGQWLVVNFTDDGSIFHSPIPEGGFGLQSWGGDYSGVTEMEFDNLVIEASNCPSVVLTPTPTFLPIPTFTPTPTITPTPTLTPTPTSTPTSTPTPSKPKVIFIPGMGASWNSEALVYNKSVDDKDWKMTPFVKNYDSFFKTLENGNYEKNKDLYIWNYDWRRPFTELVNKLDVFINEKVGREEKVVIVGHSMGGVAGRLWLQNHLSDTRVLQVVSAGSPQSGAMDPYVMWNSGRVASGDSITSTALNILLQLQKDKFDTKVKVLRSYVPSMADLIPVYDFVKKNGKVISHRNITPHNDYLHYANQNVENIYPNYRAIVGTGFSTPTWAILGDRDWIDKILGYWPDGSLRGYLRGDGDGTVVKESQHFENDNELLIKSKHGEVINKSLGELSRIVGIGGTHLTSDTELTNSRLYFIGSPAVIKANCGNDSEQISDELGFLILGDEDINCKVFIEGTDNGTYHLVSGVIGKENSWSYFESETSKGKIDVISENDSDRGSHKFILGIIKRDLNKIGLGKHIAALNKGDILGVLRNVLIFRRKNSETVVTTRLIENLESVMEEKNLNKNLFLYLKDWNINPTRKISIIDALNWEMAKNYLVQARELSAKKEMGTILRKLVVANMLVSIR